MRAVRTDVTREVLREEKGDFSADLGSVLRMALGTWEFTAKEQGGRRWVESTKRNHRGREHPGPSDLMGFPLKTGQGSRHLPWLAKDEETSRILRGTGHRGGRCLLIRGLSRSLAETGLFKKVHKWAYEKVPTPDDSWVEQSIFGMSISGTEEIFRAKKFSKNDRRRVPTVYDSSTENTHWIAAHCILVINEEQLNYTGGYKNYDMRVKKRKAQKTRCPEVGAILVAILAENCT